MKLQKTFIVLLVVLVVHHFRAANALLSSISHRGSETDYMALLAIKSKLNTREGGVLSSWNNSIQHCMWEGIFCDPEHKRVTHLNLHESSLSGTISPFIGNMSFLKAIAFSHNSLSGPIPHEIGRLWRLEILHLFNNYLTGEIPANISGCINLQSLEVGTNHLEGELPMELGALTNLKRLRLESNKLSGPIFKVIANLTSLEDIYAKRNGFTGTIPDSISRMTYLNRLDLGSNKLSGTIPPSIFNLSSLQSLGLKSNQLKGNIPPCTALIPPKLQYLSLLKNQLSGPLPISIQNLTTLYYIDFGRNYFTGTVSINFGYLPRLEWLKLLFNNFEGDINFVITTLTNCTRLDTLHLGNNLFTGVFPTVAANLSTSLTDFSISINQISGEIPIGIGNLINLRILRMSAMQLTGSIPPQLGKLQKLESLNLDYNKLKGEIPYYFGNLSHLSSLNLGNNHLQGRIPQSLGNCKEMLVLHLDNNSFNGPLPENLFGGLEKIFVLTMSRNRLQGSLPMEISKPIHLIKFDVSKNRLSGEIPQGLGNLTALQYLCMGDNLFHGQIPSSLYSLKSLIQIDLSQNKISGPLPQNLSTFPFLIDVNLSYNNFEGKVPTEGVYANVSAVFLHGNSKLCGGVRELHLPRCVEKEATSSHALKMAIMITSSFVGVIIITIATCIWLYSLSRHRRISQPASSQSLVKEPFLNVSYDMLLKATDGFSPGTLLGSGTFGSVYKGTLDGNVVAVKVLNLQYRGGSKSFMAECEALRNIRHRNLVGIITACSSIDNHRNDFKALVFEFMSNGNLDNWLHGDGNLSLIQRVNIAIDVAHALNYIHNECENPIVHCDLKPSNILLDRDMVAHVADFGLAKVLAQVAQPLNSNQSSSIGVRGTIGYAAPEYGMGGEASLEADLYSFGILLLELMTRKKPTNNMFNEDLTLNMYAKAALPDQVLQIVDSSVLTDDQNEELDSRVPRLQDRLQQREKCIAFVVRIGVACSSQMPSDRMKMGEAISELHKARSIIQRHRRNFP